MRLDRLTIKAQEALQSAASAASESGHAEILPEHLLAVLLEQPEASSSSRPISRIFSRCV